MTSSTTNAPVTNATVLRHPLASKRYMMLYRNGGEDATEVFELPSKYEAIGPIGQGTYGFVCDAIDNDLADEFLVNPPEEYNDPSLAQEEKSEIHESATHVAIKKLSKIFELNQPRMWLCATREIQLMMAFHHDNVMSARDFFIPLGGVDRLTLEYMRNVSVTFDNVYIVMKKLDYTLREVLDSSVVTEEEVEPSYVQYLTAQRQKRVRQLALMAKHGSTPGVAPPAGESACGTGSACVSQESHATTMDNSSLSGGITDSETTRHGAGGVGGGEAVEGDAPPLICPITEVPLHPLSRDYRKFILYQIFRGVGYMHLCSVIHRDLKPENIMLDRSYLACVTDFGQGRDVGVTESSVQTVLDNSTQWYAAPETLTVAIANAPGFIDHESFHGVDVWSIGCIAAEMLLGRPVFYTTRMGGVGQFLSILSVLGLPDVSIVDTLTSYRDTTDQELFRTVVEKIIGTYTRVQKEAMESAAPHDDGANPSSPAALTTGTLMTSSFTGDSELRSVLKSPFGDEDEDEIDLIAACLRWDPRDRITIAKALESPYFLKDDYDPVVDHAHTAKSVSSVRQENISDAVSGRAFLWDLYTARHPEVKELSKDLEEKHRQSSISGVLSPQSTEFAE